jgi:predicted metalloprotease
MTRIRSTDKSRIDDRRGQSGGGMGFPGGFPIPGGIKAGGGLLGLIVVVASLLLPKLLGAGDTTSSLSTDTGDSSSTSCETELEQIVCGVTNDVQDYWAQALPDAFGVAYQQTETVWFSGGVNTGCGQASSQTGPFYCPADQLVYIDLGFMQQLESELIGSTSDLAEQYILAHEYGHHVQNLLGTDDEVQRAAAQDSDLGRQYSIAMELQADCYAGVWVGARNVLESEADRKSVV